MTNTFKKAENMGLLNFANLSVMVLLISLIVMGLKNLPDSKTASGIFSLYLLLGSILSFGAFYLSFVKQTEKVKMKWFYIAVTIFMGSLYIGLYQYLTF